MKTLSMLVAGPLSDNERKMVRMVTGHDLTDLFMAAVQFVSSRRKDTGGFSATPKLPATIEDTYHALRILNLAGKYGVTEGEPDDSGIEDNLRSYLTSRLARISFGTRTTFQLLWCCRMAGVELNLDNAVAHLIDRMPVSASLEDWYYFARMNREILGKRSPLNPGWSHAEIVLQKDWRSVDEAWMHLYLSRYLDRRPSRTESELTFWFRGCQNGDGGFGFYPGTTSFIENCYSSLRALKALGGKPADPDRARRFLLCCRTVTGGFGRGLRAAPFLDATWDGLAALTLLG